MYLDITYIYVHSKNYVPRKSQTIYNFGENIVDSMFCFGNRNTFQNI